MNAIDFILYRNNYVEEGNVCINTYATTLAIASPGTYYIIYILFG